MISAFAFYLFAAVTLFAGLMVITAKNPVHSVLFLILAFFNAAGLFVLLGAEFVAMILVIVYVGAVAVLFLFVVMMLDISFSELRKGAMQYVPAGVVIGLVLLAELIFIVSNWTFAPGAVKPELVSELTNTEQLGAVLYTRYLLAFQASGLILLVAMIGAIVLTHRRRPGVRRQVIAEQNARTVEQSLEVRKMPSGSGAN